jgi:hypothetical protein
MSEACLECRKIIIWECWFMSWLYFDKIRILIPRRFSPSGKGGLKGDLEVLSDE